MTKKETLNDGREWEEMTVSEREAIVMYALTSIDLERADPVFACTYIEAQNAAENELQEANLDLKREARILELREQGRMLSEDITAEYASSMLDLSYEERDLAYLGFESILEETK